MLPGVADALKAAFPVIGAVATIGIFTELGDRIEKVSEALKQMQTAPQRIAAAFRGINGPLQQTNDELAVSNDKLANEIAKLQGKPQNGIKLALDEARVSADKLAESLAKDLDTVSKLFEQNQTHWYERVLGKASTSDIKDAFFGKDGFGGFQQQITEITLKANQQLAEARTPKDADKIRQQERIDLEKAYGAQIAWVNQQLKDRQGLQTKTVSVPVLGFSAGGAQATQGRSVPEDQRKAIAELQGLLQNLQAAKNSIALQYQNEELSRTRDALQIANSNTNQIKGPLDYAVVSLRSFQITLQNQGKAAADWQNRLGNIQKLATDMRIDVGASLDEENRKRDQALATLNQQIDAAHELAAAQTKGTDAAFAAQEKIRLARIQDPTLRSLSGQLDEAERDAQITGQVAQIERQANAMKRLADVANLGRDAQRRAQIANIQASGQDPKVIQAQIDQLNAAFGLQDKQSLRGATAAEGMQRYFSEMRDNVQSTGQMVHDVLGGAFQSINYSLSAMVAGQQVSWSSFFRGIAAQIASLGLSNLEGRLFGGLFGGSTSAASHGSGVGGFLASLFGGFRASGGSVDPNKAYVVGEQGPEIWSPPAGGGTIIPNNKIGGSVAYYSIDARGADAAAVEMRVQRSLAAVHGSAVRNAVAVQAEMAKRSPKGARR
jgi:hypothetical protein